jgi:recombination protein RecA
LTGASFDEFLVRVHSKYGDEAARIIDGSKIKKVDVISTGSILVDEALGIGGFPQGRICEIYGPEGSGKCLPADTYIATEYGLLTVQELFEQEGMVASCTAQVTPHRVRLLNRYFRYEPTVKFTHNYKRPLIKLTTATGFQVRSTYNHPHLVMSKTGNWIWKKTKDISKDDFLISGQNKNNIPYAKTCNKDIAYLLGVLIADAYFGENRISVTNDDPYVMDILRNVAPATLGTEVIEYPVCDSKSVDFHFNSKIEITKFYGDYGFEPGVAKNKNITKIIRSFSKKSLRHVLSGFFDCECSIDLENSSIEVVSASWDLLFQVKLLLQINYGIVTTLNPKVVKHYEGTNYWRLELYGKNVYKFAKHIGSRSPLRQPLLREVATKVRDSKQTNIDVIPNMRSLIRDMYNASETTRAHNDLVQDITGKNKVDLTYYKLGRIINEVNWDAAPGFDRLKEVYKAGYFYDRVEEIEYCSEEPTFDFEMQETHSFIANGLVTHNTTLALHVIAEAQRRKKDSFAAFIDAEHALDISLAKKIGVDTKRLVVSQPDYGEQGLEIAEMAAESSKFDVIVLDSVSALTPKAEIEGEMVDQQMGLQARMMGKGMRKIVAVNSKSHSTMIFINQLRKKIGIMFGNPETTTGGEALKFYASVRIDIRRVKSLTSKIDGEDKVIGNVVKVKIAKNKLAMPYREIETELIFGKGFNKEGELLALGVNQGILEREGATYLYKGKSIARGKTAAQILLQENKDIFNAIYADIATARGLKDAKNRKEV